jgi:hypothetical protein
MVIPVNGNFASVVLVVEWLVIPGSKGLVLEDVTVTETQKTGIRIP